MRCESTVTVARPPAEVFPWLIEPDKVPQWMSGLRAYEPLEPLPLRVGSRIRQELEVGGRPMEFQLEVTRLDAPHGAELRLEGAGFKAANAYAVADHDGGARVTWTIAGDPTSFKSRLIAPMVESRLQERLDRDLTRLRTVLAGTG